MNVHDSERMAGMLDDLGYETTDVAESADVILLNTCAVREKPEHKLYSELGIFRKLKDNNPNLIIGVTGCMAQRDADQIRARVPEVDILLGPRNIHHLPRLVNAHKSTFTELRNQVTKYDQRLKVLLYSVSGVGLLAVIAFVLALLLR